MNSISYKSVPDNNDGLSVTEPAPCGDDAQPDPVFDGMKKRTAVLRRCITLVVGLALAVGVAFSVWGLAHLDWPRCIPFNADGLNRLMMLLGASSAIVVAMAAVLKWHPFAAGLTVAFLIALAANAAWPLLVALWFWIASMLVGDAFMRLCGSRARGSSIPFLVGAALIGTLVGLTAHLPINSPATFSAMLLAPCILFRNRLRDWINAAIRYGSVPTNIRRSGFWLNASLTSLAILHFAVALMPEVAHDALAFHLFIPAHLALRGSWGFDVATYSWAVMPMLGNWIFSVGFMLGGENGARLLNCLFILTLATIIRDLVLWGGGEKRGATWAQILFLSTPLTFTESSTLLVESVWACYVVAGGLCLLRTASAAPRAGGLAVCGLLFGAALAAKAWSLVMLPAIGIVAIMIYPRILHPARFRGVVAAALSLTAVGSVPYITAWALTGNPVYPFFNKVFNSQLSSPINLIDKRWKAGLDWQTLYTMTFDSTRYIEGRNGAVGFEWLPLLPATCLLIALYRDRRGLGILGFGFGTLAAVFAVTPYLRYVFPAEAFLLAAIGIGLSIMPLTLRPAGTLLLACITLLNCLFLNAGPIWYDDFPLHIVLHPRDRDPYIAARVPMRKAVAVVNELNSALTPVAILGPSSAAGLAADALYASPYNMSFLGELAAAKSKLQLSELLGARGVEYVIADTAWKDPAQLTFLDEISSTVFSSPRFTVKRIRDDWFFTQELLTSTGGDWSGWQIPPCVQRTPEGDLIVKPGCNAFHVATATPGRRYRNAVTACSPSGKSYARTQLNWLDAKGQPLRVDAHSFECGTQPVEHIMDVKAPANAAKVVVYAAAHANLPVIIVKNSLQQ